MTTPRSVGFGVIGARSMVATRAVLPALDRAAGAHVAAACSLGGPVPPAWSAQSVETYDDVIDHDDVDVVYVPLPNGMHRDWVLAAVSRGKSVLCEKPLGVDAEDATDMVRAARSAGVLLAEAWMTPFDPRWRRVLRLIDDGAIGSVVHVDAAFTFTIGPEHTDNYRWDSVQGGGALLDVGIYTLGMPTTLWGPEPTDVTVERSLSPTGVDERTRVELRWGDDRTATITCSFVDDDRQELTVIGTAGSLRLGADAYTGGADADSIEMIRADGGIEVLRVAGGDPYQSMIETFAACQRGGVEWPRPVERSIELARLLDRIATT